MVAESEVVVVPSRAPARRLRVGGSCVVQAVHDRAVHGQIRSRSVGLEAGADLFQEHLDTLPLTGLRIRRKAAD